MVWGKEERSKWAKRLESADDDQRALWDRLHSPAPVELEGPGFTVGEKMATRSASRQALRRDRRQAAGISRRVRRPRRLDQDSHRPISSLLGGRPRGPGHPLRSPGARDGVHHQRDGSARRAEAVRRHLLRVQRLHAAGGPPLGVDVGSIGLGMDSRLGLPRRGRPDPSADRASPVAPGDAQSLGDPTRRCQRDPRRLGDGPQPTRRSGRSPPHPSGRPGAGNRSRRGEERRICAPGGHRRDTRSPPAPRSMSRWRRQGSSKEMASRHGW